MCQRVTLRPLVDDYSTQIEKGRHRTRGWGKNSSTGCRAAVDMGKYARRDSRLENSKIRQPLLLIKSASAMGVCRDTLVIASTVDEAGLHDAVHIL
jgi:hypothetical protein